MKTITKYKADDGREFTSELECAKHELLIEAVDEAMLPMGKQPDYPRNQDGWVQHDPKVVMKCKQAILDLCKPMFAKSWPVFNEPAENVHPGSIVGRILDDAGGPLRSAWLRFYCTDAQGREHNQPYFAINGPAKDHTCIEVRS